MTPYSSACNLVTPEMGVLRFSLRLSLGAQLIVGFCAGVL